MVGAVALDSIALGAAVALVFAAGADSLDRGLAIGVLVAAVTAALIGSIDVTPTAPPGHHRTPARAGAHRHLARARQPPDALALALRDTLMSSMVVLASVIVLALGLRMALLTRAAPTSSGGLRPAASPTSAVSRVHDPLTGLPNRTLLEDRLAMAVAGQRRSGSVLAVLFCDLDKFKLINDTVGHDGGDAVLVVIAERLRRAVRATDTVSRLGGDEFVVLCPDLRGEDELIEVVERLLSLMSEPMEVAGHNVVVSCSVGVSLVRSGTAPSSLADLVREADAAMYRAKANGRNRWERLDLAEEKPAPRYASVRGTTTDPSWAFTASPRLDQQD